MKIEYEHDAFRSLRLFVTAEYVLMIFHDSAGNVLWLKGVFNQLKSHMVHRNLTN